VKTVIRFAGPDDAAAIARLEHECFSNPWSLASVAEELENPCAFIYVAECRRRIVGWAGMLVAADEGQILNVAVSPSYRRRGIGRKLVEALIELAKEKKLSYLTLEMRRSNSPAAALYSLCGFLPAGMRKAYYTRPDEDAVIMNLTLPGDSEAVT
jgi:ribosomal-protein-alanine N-acetyltransferase